MNAVFTVFLVGLLGSLGHCVGMCGPVTVLLTRPLRAATPSTSTRPIAWLTFLHLGRLSTYAFLGMTIALLGKSLWRLASFLSVCVSPLIGGGQTAPPEDTLMAGFHAFQGFLALLVAALLVYMALATIGRVPAAETLLTAPTRRWGSVVRAMTAPDTGRSPLRPYVLGLVWGLLPCGLVYSALLIASTSPTFYWGGLTMFAFGLGTLPAMATTGWLSAQGRLPARQAARYLAALLIFLFGVQMALRGLAAWGWISHMKVAGLMLW